MLATSSRHITKPAQNKAPTMTMSSDLLSSVGTDVDERLVAKAALDGAEEHLRSLCASHASTFVSVERRGTKLESLLRDLQAAIANVLENNVASSQEALEKDSLSHLSENHRLRRRTLLQHSSLLELLELPSLMDACVRSNLYQEALSIASFANALERRQGSNNVVMKVVQQIRTRELDLRRHLVGRLKQQVTMPECLEIVTSLRRLNSIQTENTSFTGSDQELKLHLDFLEARDAWLDAALRSGDSFFDTIEQYRARYVVVVVVVVTHLMMSACLSSLLPISDRFISVFEIATQFNAIFRASTATSTTPLLNMWTSRRIHSFLGLLKQHSFSDSSSLRDAWEASVFFATSMGRLGADFTPLLGKLFADKMVALVTLPWKEGLTTLSETLAICRDAGVASPLVSTSVIVSNDSMTTVVEDGQPPRVLLALPPLARLVNAFLVGLNELRRCLFPCLFGELRKHLNEFLMETLVVLETNERAVRAPGLRGEARQLREVATRLLEMTEQVVEPYLRGALELALGDLKAAKHFLETEKKQEENVELPMNENEQGGEDGRALQNEETNESKAPTSTEEPNEISEVIPQKEGHTMVAPVTDTEQYEDLEEDVVAQGDGWAEEEDALD